MTGFALIGFGEDECLLSARHYGVEDEVLRSLADTLPHEDWPGLAGYLIGRSMQHGPRRAEDMREAARTVRDAGVEPLLGTAIAERRDRAGRLDRRPPTTSKGRPGERRRSRENDPCPPNRSSTSPISGISNC
ncbi:MAG: DUF1932 domain-containing protein [Methylobacterium frigidaeris]